MGACANKGKGAVLFVPVNKKPVPLNVAIAKALPFAFQRVVIMDRGQRYSLSQLVDNPCEFVEVVASAVH
jgi:hypothetical protein